MPFSIPRQRKLLDCALFMWPPHKAINNVPSLQPFTLVQKRPCFSRNLLNLLVFSGGRLWYGKRAQGVKREIHWVQSSEGGIFVFAAPSWSWMRQFGHAVKWKIDLQTLNWFENKDTCLYLVFWFPVHLPFEKTGKNTSLAPNKTRPILPAGFGMIYPAISPHQLHSNYLFSREY